MQNIKLILAYDGTNFKGWQETIDGPSIESSLRGAISQIMQHTVQLSSASRTDAGVHARGLAVSFFTSKDGLDLGKLVLGLNACLPKDIRVLSAEFVSQDFHATIDSKGKEYHYSICSLPSQLPQDRLYEWHYPYPLDLFLMRLAAEKLVGTHDFLAFCNAKKNEEYSDTVRTILSIEIEEPNQGKILIKIRGTSFLYKMARNIVGFLVYVGRGKITIEEAGRILESKDRTQGGITAPACGLTLHEVFYS